MDRDEYDDEEWAERVDRFADPGGDSALHPADDDNPRDLPCPSCGWPNRLTPADRARGYQCDACAVAAERGTDIDYYEDGVDAAYDEVHGTVEEVEASGNSHDGG